MSSSPLSFHIRKPSKLASIDDLALVKAAAWAWYHHGSGSDGPSIRKNTYLSSNRKAQEPSRYKLEVIKEVEETLEFSKYSLPSPNVVVPIHLSPSNTNTSLLDKYEIERISRQLDHYIETSDQEREQKIKKIKGLFRYRMMCGSSSRDVVERRALSNPQLMEKYARPVQVVKFSSCLPEVANGRVKSNLSWSKRVRSTNTHDSTCPN